MDPLGSIASSMYIHTDYHTHTRHSDGHGTVDENVAAAARIGLRAVGISDHGPANLFGVGVRSLEHFAHIRREVERARLQWPNIGVYFGVEANLVSLDGHLDIPLEMQSDFDYVMVGLHPLVRPFSLRHAGGFALVRLMEHLSSASRRKARIKNTDALIKAVHNNRIDVITHPGYRIPIETRELAKACAATGTALEINSGHEHITLEYLEIAADEGASFVIGSDAHSPARVGDFSRALALAKAAGLTSREVRNAADTP